MAKQKINDQTLPLIITAIISWFLILKIMSKKIKLEMTEAQLNALVEVIDECSAMIGASGGDADKNRTHWVKLLDRMLKNNGYKRAFL